MRQVAVFLVVSPIAACASRPVETRTPAAPALTEAAARLTARGIALDPAGQRPDRLRTGYFCHRPGEAWDLSFTSPATPPVPFSAEGTLEEQATARGKCPLLLQVEVTTAPSPEGTQLEVQSAWWRLKEHACAPLGDPLMGKVRCDYAWEGATGEAGVEAFIYGIMSGI